MVYYREMRIEIRSHDSFHDSSSIPHPYHYDVHTDYADDDDIEEKGKMKESKDEETGISHNNTDKIHELPSSPHPDDNDNDDSIHEMGMIEDNNDATKNTSLPSYKAEDTNESEEKQLVDIKKEDIPNIHNETTKIVKLPTMPNDRTILYLHVGKTGGITLEDILRSNCLWRKIEQNRNACFNKLHFATLQRSTNGTTKVTFGPDESVLSHLTKMTMHMFVDKEFAPFAKHNATSFLFTVRNPIDRAVSAFNMNHILNQPVGRPSIVNARSMFYTKCFPTIEDLAIVLTNQLKHDETKFIEMPDKNNPNVNRTINCYDLGRDVLGGRKVNLFNEHLQKNYKFYTDFTSTKYPEKEVLVIRTEHLWDDAEELNLALTDSLVKDGAVYKMTHTDPESSSTSTSTSAFGKKKGHVFDHNSGKRPVRSGLSQEGKKIVCCHLSTENHLFEGLVRRAANLDEMEKEIYLDDLYNDCGISKLERKEWFQSESEEEDVFPWVKWASAEGCM